MVGLKIQVNEDDEAFKKLKKINTSNLKRNKMIL